MKAFCIPLQVGSPTPGMVTRLQEQTDGVSEYRSLCRCLWIHIRVTKGAVDLQTPFGFNQCIQPSNSPGHARAWVSQPAFGCSLSCLWVKIQMLSIWHNRAVIMRCGRQRVNWWSTSIYTPFIWWLAFNHFLRRSQSSLETLPLSPQTHNSSSIYAQ